MRWKPSFLIAIDTEGDNLWARPAEISANNASYLPRFQACCERYGLKPTYLTNYEMARSPEFVGFGRQVIRQGTGEIGMHLHAWNSPPIVPLTDDDHRHQPYLIEYRDDLLHDKVAVLTELLEQTFEIKMTSHRAGRWAFDGRYARALVRHGYTVDCSVTPHVNWRHFKGDPAGRGGTDYRGFPEDAYFLDPADIGRAGASPLLEVPMTILAAPLGGDLPQKLLRPFTGLRVADKAARRLARLARLQPDGRNLDTMLAILERALEQRRPYVQFTLHSSELMPGGSPTFRTAEQIETLYQHLEILFREAGESFVGRTLSEFHHHHDARLAA